MIFVYGTGYPQNFLRVNGPTMSIDEKTWCLITRKRMRGFHILRNRINLLSTKLLSLCFVFLCFESYFHMTIYMMLDVK